MHSDVVGLEGFQCFRYETDSFLTLAFTALTGEISNCVAREINQIAFGFFCIG